YWSHQKGGQKVDAENQPRPKLSLLRIRHPHLLQVEREERDDHTHGTHHQKLRCHQNVEISLPCFHWLQSLPPQIFLSTFISLNEIRHQKNCLLEDKAANIHHECFNRSGL